MNTSQRADLLIQAFLGNPFEVDEAVVARAREQFGNIDVGAYVDELVKQKDTDRAKTVLLSVGHLQACATTDPGEVLAGDVLPADVEKALPRARDAYLRIVMAAGRCYQALAAIRGSSQLMRDARRATWSACFGDSLRHALDLERVIRDHDILILGETGTGKDRFADAIQRATPGLGDGSPAPRSAINAAAIPETLVESELFGHVKGAFTGATDPRAGRLRSASGGSFFLDEVGDLPPHTQVKLLRVIETNEVYPVGSDVAHKVDVRYVAATHKDLTALADRREFRRDLYERLAGNILRIPPLRDRPGDIVEIGEYFIDTYLPTPVAHSGADDLSKWLVSAEAQSYAWPGNVRELQNALRNVLLGLPADLRKRSREQVAAPSVELPERVAEGVASMQEVSDWYLAKVVRGCDGNLSQASRLLGIDRSTVRRRLKALGDAG